ncbi:peroxiredoxin-like family protein [Fodinibius halophilus]|uniref:thioredoxin-dependent peroxiredoxin n=1 Tax=Fodinibius halophilus TaxID=1736908 RepID=A0A6M1T040_9BACT|nr:peroxiredoxin-like family protein [Fodinibius halophilus]NGP89478.1 AhpC/TSA family protein [Fodinibius halophilus]
MKLLIKAFLFCSILFLLASSTYAQKSYAQKATEVNPVLTGTTIPNSSVKTVDGNTVKLKKLVSQKPTVLIFYRGGWCPYCNRHLAELQRIEQQLVDMGYQILAVSPDRPEILKKSISKHDLDYTLLSDSPMNLTKAFGLAFKVDNKTVKRYKEVGIDLEKNSGHNHHLLPAPAVYLINPDGLITFQYVNPNYKTRINSKVLLTAAEAYYPESNN